MSDALATKMQYGAYHNSLQVRASDLALIIVTSTVRLGNSGLKVSRIILGTAQYGHKGWQDWVIDDEEEVVKHIQFAYVSFRVFRLLDSDLDLAIHM